MAASYYGRARTTRDVDVRIQISEDNFESFLDKLQSHGLKVNRNRVKRQLASGYNVLEFQDSLSPYKADFIIDEVRPAGRRKGTGFGVTTFYDTPETLILSKLRMIKATLSNEKSYKDKEDIGQILSNTKVDTEHLVKLAKKHGTEDILKPLLTRQVRPRKRKVVKSHFGVARGVGPFTKEDELQAHD